MMKSMAKSAAGITATVRAARRAMRSTSFNGSELSGDDKVHPLRVARMGVTLKACFPRRVLRNPHSVMSR
jgi:hypothetical protein